MHQKLTQTFSKYNKIILVGGGTGGHIQPILNIIGELHTSITPTLEHSNTLLWIGGKDSNEEKEAKNAGVNFQSIPTLKLTTTRSPKVLLYPFVLIRGIVEARRILLKYIQSPSFGVKRRIQEKKNMDPSLHSGGQDGVLSHSRVTSHEGGVCVFSKGGPGSVAIGIAAWSLGIPLYVHESDTIPGRSNRILAKFATQIFLGFESAKKYFDPRKCETIGQILHPVFYPQHSSTPALQHSISWKTEKKHLLIICGSQGARAIFEEILKNLETILEGHEVILVLGKLNVDMRKDFDEKIQHSSTPALQHSLTLIDWISQSDLAGLIQDTDIAITRGSATTLAELTSLSELRITNYELRIIIIPLPYAADNHQYYNALEYEKMGHVVLEQKNIHLLSETLEKIGQNSQLSNI